MNFTIHTAQGVQVDHADTIVAAQRLVDYYQRTNLGSGPFTIRPVVVAVQAPAKRLSAMDRFFRFFGVTDAA